MKEFVLKCQLKGLRFSEEALNSFGLTEWYTPHEATHFEAIFYEKETNVQILQKKAKDWFKNESLIKKLIEISENNAPQFSYIKEDYGFYGEYSNCAHSASTLSFPFGELKEIENNHYLIGLTSNEIPYAAQESCSLADSISDATTWKLVDSYDYFETLTQNPPLPSESEELANRIGSYPIPLQTLIYLYLFEIEVGGSGISNWLLQASSCEITGVYEAFFTIGFHPGKAQLHKALESAVASGSDEYEFMHDSYERGWFSQFTGGKVSEEIEESEICDSEDYLQCLRLFVQNNIDTLSHS